MQFSEIMDKISVYIGKQRKNSEGKCKNVCTFIFVGMTTCFPHKLALVLSVPFQSQAQLKLTQSTD